MYNYSYNCKYTQAQILKEFYASQPSSATKKKKLDNFFF